MRKKTTKRSLLASVLALALCVIMLVGTTFAWFTDTASTGVNKIVSGKLDVALEMKEGGNWVSAEGKTLEFVKAKDAPTNEKILWKVTALITGMMRGPRLPCWSAALRSCRRALPLVRVCA